MKWREFKNLTPEERKEMRRAVAKHTSDQIIHSKKVEAMKKEQELKNSEEAPTTEEE